MVHLLIDHQSRFELKWIRIGMINKNKNKLFTSIIGIRNEMSLFSFMCLTY